VVVGRITLVAIGAAMLAAPQVLSLLSLATCIRSSTTVATPIREPIYSPPWRP
jgi:hypothetical protein